jgi:hypothetical protein
VQVTCSRRCAVARLDLSVAAPLTSLPSHDVDPLANREKWQHKVDGPQSGPQTPAGASNWSGYSDSAPICAAIGWVDRRHRFGSGVVTTSVEVDS